MNQDPARFRALKSITARPSGGEREGSKDSNLEVRRRTLLSRAHDDRGGESKQSLPDRPHPTWISLDELLEAVSRSDIRDAVEKGANYYIRHYLAENCPKPLKPETVKAYAFQLNRYVDSVGDQPEGSFLSAEATDFRKHVKWLIRQGYRETTIDGVVSTLHMFHAHIEAKFKEDPAIPLSEFRLFDIEEYDEDVPDALERGALSQDEMRRLLEETECFRDWLMVRILYEAALRNSEVRNLKLSHIDRSQDDPLLFICDSKGDKNRKVPIRQELALEIDHWIDSLRPAYSTWAPQSEYLFPAKNSCKLETGKSVRSIVHDAADQAGLLADKERDKRYRADGTRKYRVDVHVLRHTGNTEWQRAGVPIERRQTFAGHDDPDTNNVYSHGTNPKKVEERRVFRQKLNAIVV